MIIQNNDKNEETKKLVIQVFEAVHKDNASELNKFLTEYPYLVNATDGYGHTPLFDALFCQHIECARIILTEPVRRHIDASIIDDWGQDPYDIALKDKRLAELIPLLKPIFCPAYKPAYKPVSKEVYDIGEPT